MQNVALTDHTFVSLCLSLYLFADIFPTALTWRYSGRNNQEQYHAHSVIGLSTPWFQTGRRYRLRRETCCSWKEPNHAWKKKTQAKRKRERERERQQAGRRAAPAWLITTTRGALIGTRTRGSGLRVAQREKQMHPKMFTTGNSSSLASLFSHSSF